jgi:hypothetical protein
MGAAQNIGRDLAALEELLERVDAHLESARRLCVAGSGEPWEGDVAILLACTLGKNPPR